jgi:hypothetical protein
MSTESINLTNSPSSTTEFRVTSRGREGKKKKRKDFRFIRGNGNDGRGHISASY